MRQRSPRLALPEESKACLARGHKPSDFAGQVCHAIATQATKTKKPHFS